MSEETNALATGVQSGASVPETVAETNAETATAEQAAQANSAEAEGEDDEESESEKPRRGKSGSAKLREQRERLIRDNAALQTELRLMREQAQAQRPQEPVKPEAAPKEEDFNGDFLAYLKAQSTYEARQAVKAEIEAATNAQREQARRAEMARIEAQTQAREKQFSATVPDYFEVVKQAAQDGVFQQPFVVEALHISENGPALAYRLATDRALAEKIAALPPTLALIEIGRLEATISATKPRTDSRAPAPIAPVRGSAPPSPAIGSSMTDYARWRNSK